MINIIPVFEQIYIPKKILVIYESVQKPENKYYVESYDADANGKPINAHPLSLEESADLALKLNSSNELNNSFVKPKGLLPENILYLTPDKPAYAVWYTPSQEVDLSFVENLTIPSGRAFVPGLVWKADKQNLYLYAIKDNKKPCLNTQLFNAPFFNLYDDAKVCMGNVEIDFPCNCFLEEFIEHWQGYFFKSYFSHLIQNKSPVKGNIVQLWKQLITTGKAFPVNQLTGTNNLIKDIIQ